MKANRNGRTRTWCVGLALLGLASCEGGAPVSPTDGLGAQSAAHAQSLMSASTRLEFERLDVMTGMSHQSIHEVRYAPDGALILALSTLDDAVFLGTAVPHVGSGTTSAIAKVRTDNTLAWKTLLHGAVIEAMAVGDEGETWVGGRLEQATSLQGISLQVGHFLAKVTSTGGIAWARNTRPPPGKELLFISMARAPGNRFAATLVTAGDGPAILVSYRSSDGEEEWSRVLNQTPGSGLAATSVTVDTFGQIYIAGYYTGSARIPGLATVLQRNGTAPFAASFTPEGGARWLREVDERGVGLSIDNRDGHLAVGYSNHVASLDLAGNIRWRRELGQLAEGPWGNRVAFGPSGELLVSGGRYTETTLGPNLTYSTGPLQTVLKFSRVSGYLSATYLQQPVLGNNGFPLGHEVVQRAMAVNQSTGQVVVVGQMGSSSDFGSGPVQVNSPTDGFLLTLGQ